MPQSAQSREVVLELRLIDLVLALGASRVLREDVEDELRSIDDTKLQCVFESALLTGIQLIVDDNGLRVASSDLRLDLDELALADVGAGIGPCPALHELPDRLDACGPHQLTDFGELVGLVGIRPEHRHEEAALGLGSGRRIRVMVCHPGILPLAPDVRAPPGYISRGWMLERNGGWQNGPSGS